MRRQTIELTPAESHAILGLSASATLLELKKAYRLKALQNHPDRFPDQQQKKAAGERMRKINAAYLILKEICHNGPRPRRATPHPETQDYRRRANPPKTGVSQGRTAVDTSDLFLGVLAGMSLVILFLTDKSTIPPFIAAFAIFALIGKWLTHNLHKTLTVGITIFCAAVILLPAFSYLLGNRAGSDTPSVNFEMQKIDPAVGDIDLLIQQYENRQLPENIDWNTPSTNETIRAIEDYYKSLEEFFPEEFE